MNDCWVFDYQSKILKSWFQGLRIWFCSIVRKLKSSRVYFESQSQFNEYEVHYGNIFQVLQGLRVWRQHQHETIPRDEWESLFERAETSQLRSLLHSLPWGVDSEAGCLLHEAQIVSFFLAQFYTVHCGVWHGLSIFKSFRIYHSFLKLFGSKQTMQ